MKTALRTSLKHSIIRNDMNWVSYVTEISCYKTAITQSKAGKMPSGRVESLKSMGRDHTQPLEDSRETCLCPFWVITAFLLASGSKILQNCIFSLDLLPLCILSLVTCAISAPCLRSRSDVSAHCFKRLLRSCLVVALFSPVLASSRDVWARMCRKENKRADRDEEENKLTSISPLFKLFSQKCLDIFFPRVLTLL